MNAEPDALEVTILTGMSGAGRSSAADVLEECVRADVNIVETVAHMMSAVRFVPDADVICDIGGQDIKVLMLEHGDIKNLDRKSVV